MKKIPCLFQRDFTDRRRPVLLQTVMPGCEWVLANEGRATRKYDGTACLVDGGRLFKRYDAKRGKAPPIGFVPCGDPDLETGHRPGWIEVDDGPENKWHREAWTGLRASDGSCFRSHASLADGTYELCGPRIQGNPEHVAEHTFFRHGDFEIEIPSLNWEGLRAYLEQALVEGIVWHHPDGRMAKLRRDDYGFKWPIT